MKKFLLSWILIITFIFFDLPLQAFAYQEQVYYLYSVTVPYNTVAVSGPDSYSSGQLFTEQNTFYSLKDILYPSGDVPSQPYPFDAIYYTFVNCGSNVTTSTGTVIYAFSHQLVGTFGISQRYDVQPSSWESFPFVNPGSSYPVRFDFTNANISLGSSGFRLRPQIFASNAVSGITYPLNVNITYYFVLVATQQIIGSNAQLISIDSNIDEILAKQNQLISILNSGFSTVNSDLLNILSVLNQIAASGGSGGTGTAAIVGAVNGATAAIGQVLSQQQASSADIVGAVNSQTSSLNNAIQGQTNSLNSTLSLVDASVNKITSTLEQDKQDNIAAATEKGNELTGMATQIKNTAETSWDALSFPIDFTNQVFQVFSGGTSSAAYTRAYGDVLGYRYNADTGGLEPIYRRYRDGTPRVTGGTTITFPAFSLPVPGVGTLQLWDSYEFDLSVISGYLPALFDALHLIIGILLIYWVIGYLIDLGHDIIG